MAEPSFPAQRNLPVDAHETTTTPAQIVLLAFPPDKQPTFWIKERSTLLAISGRLFSTTLAHLENKHRYSDLILNLLARGSPQVDVVRQVVVDEDGLPDDRIVDVKVRPWDEEVARAIGEEAGRFFADLSTTLKILYRGLGGETE